MRKIKRKIKVQRDKKSGRIILNHRTPIVSAGIFRQEIRPNLILHQADCYDYGGKCYQAKEDQTIVSEVQQFLDDAVCKAKVEDKKGNVKEVLVPFNPRAAEVKEVAFMLRNDAHLPKDKLSPPAFLSGNMNAKDARLIIPCQNGLLHLPTRKKFEHTPNFFSTYCLPINYDPRAPEPQLFLEFLSQVMGGRQHLIDGLQEAFGYTISQNRNRQKIFFLRGKKRSGKGTLMRVLGSLCGDDQITGNCAYPSMGVLGEKYGLENCVNKLVIMVTDMTITKSTDMGLAAERLKAISGQDPVDVRRMARPHLGGVKMPGQFWLASNIIPNFGASTDALNSRLLVWPFDVSFEGNEDIDLSEKLTTVESLTGILNWSLKGLDRLNTRGRFLESPESKAAKTELLKLSNPVAGFIAGCCELGAGMWVDKDVLAWAYQDYCEAAGLSPLSPSWFANKLKDAVDAMGGVISEGRRSSEIAHRQRPTFWTGLQLNPDFRVRYYQHDPDLAEVFTGDRNEQSIYSIKTERKTGAPLPRERSDFGPGSDTMH